MPSVENMTVTTYHISSSFTGTAAWRASCWDAVGFSTAPTAIVADSSVHPGTGTGAGTVADPFRRSTGNLHTLEGQHIEDTFTFGTCPSGTSVRYANHGDRYGWHFVSISGITFDLDVCR